MIGKFFSEHSALNAFRVNFDRSAGTVVSSVFGIETSSAMAVAGSDTGVVSVEDGAVVGEETGNSTIWDDPSQLSSTQIILVGLGVICKLLDGCHSTPSLLMTMYL